MPDSTVAAPPPEHPPFLQHHFDDAEQQYESSTLGMWAFLATEILFFGGMFCAYAVYRGMYPEAFAATSRYMNVKLGAINTAVLICSSLSMALGVRAAQLGQKRALITLLLSTIFLGSVFLGIKGVEYKEKWDDHHIPGHIFGRDFQFEEKTAPHDSNLVRHVQLLYFFYFAMTGMHAVHMIIGVGLLSFLIWAASRNRFGPSYYTPVEMVGLYWHFVDIVWIFLFPLLYLIGRTR